MQNFSHHCRTCDPVYIITSWGLDFYLLGLLEGAKQAACLLKRKRLDRRQKWKEEPEVEEKRNRRK